MGWLALALVLAVGAQGSVAVAQDVGPDARVFTYGKLLTEKDKLSDGEVGTDIPLDNVTLLVWVDLDPGARFVHDSTYVLISADGVRMLAGQWWPVVNGKSVFGTPPWFPETDAVVRFPIDVPDKPVLSSEKDELEDVRVYAGAYALRPGDVLEDPAWIWPLRIDEQTLLYWVDLHPTAKFEHDTIYLLIGPDGVSRAEGLWWPVSNGRRILYGEDNDWGVKSAFDLLVE
jgi:hypothetical protein